MTRAGSTPSAATLAASLAAALVCAPGAGASDQRAQSPPPSYRETIPGTLVTFEMQLVPGSDQIAPFYLGRTEVTWDMYDVFALALDEKNSGQAHAVARPSKPYGAPDYGWGHAGFPAISIAREAAAAFAAWLSTRTGKTYRLPTDAEWEHAARLAGPPSDETAWHRGNAVTRTRPVASRAPDRLGLFDLYGNVAEWVDAGADARVTRGGSFRNPLADLGPSARALQDDSWNERDPQLPKSRWWLSDAPFVGFRLARSMR